MKTMMDEWQEEIEAKAKKEGRMEGWKEAELKATTNYVSALMGDDRSVESALAALGALHVEGELADEVLEKLGLLAIA